MIKKMSILFLFLSINFSLIAFDKKDNITKLSKPILIQGELGPLKIEKGAIAHPTVYDWNHDGKKDLIIGEFEKKAKFRVFLNEGTDSKPKFSGKSFYGKDIEGNPMFVNTC
jgi:hypothetical protein